MLENSAVDKIQRRIYFIVKTRLGSAESGSSRSAYTPGASDLVRHGFCACAKCFIKCIYLVMVYLTTNWFCTHSTSIKWFFESLEYKNMFGSKNIFCWLMSSLSTALYRNHILKLLCSTVTTAAETTEGTTFPDTTQATSKSPGYTYSIVFWFYDVFDCLSHVH